MKNTAVTFKEAKAKGDHREASVTGVFPTHPVEEAMHQDSHPDREGEEREHDEDEEEDGKGPFARGDDPEWRLFPAAAKGKNEGQHHDADDVIEDGRRHKRRSDRPVELANLLEGGHRDGDARRGQDDPIIDIREDGIDAFLGQRIVKEGIHMAVNAEQVAAQEPQGQGEKDAECGDGDARKPLLLDDFEIRLETRGEEDEDDPDLREVINARDGVIVQDEVLFSRDEIEKPEEQSSEEEADDLGHFDFADEQRASFAEKQDEGKR